MADPRPITRQDLARFLPDQRSIRAFEKLFDLLPSDLIKFDGYINATRQQLIEVESDYNAEIGNYIIVVDATLGVVNITLPDAASAIVSDYDAYISIGVTKVDTTANVVNILPQSGQTVVGEASQQLLLDGEVLNFISDGSNWVLSA